MRANAKKKIKRSFTFLGLSALLGFVIATHLGFHRTSTAADATKASTKWVQPAELNKAYPNSIANNIWSFDYSKVENMIWKINFDEAKTPLLTAQTAKSLERIVAMLPQGLDTKNSQRLTFLVQKSVPGSSGESLAALVSQYYFYQQEYTAYIQTINSATGEEKLALLTDNSQRMKRDQTRFFGHLVASRLFKQKNARADFLNAMRVVNLTPSLSAEEKAAQLSELRKNYQQQLTH